MSISTLVVPEAQQVAPIQLAIRLLIPEGSLLLELDEVRRMIGLFDTQPSATPGATRTRRWVRCVRTFGRCSKVKRSAGALVLWPTFGTEAAAVWKLSRRFAFVPGEFRRSVSPRQRPG
jgi:hypothetical protein